jgi:hypothetical protein
MVVPRVIYSSLLAVGIVVSLGPARSASAQAPILPPGGHVGGVGGGHVGGVGGGHVGGSPVGGVGGGRIGGIGRPSIGGGIAQPNFRAGLGRPAFTGIPRPNLGGQGIGIGRVGGLGYGSGYRPYYHRHFYGGNYGYYPLAPFDYPYIVPNYSYVPYSDYGYQGLTCRYRWVSRRVVWHHRYHWRRVRRRVCY